MSRTKHHPEAQDPVELLLKRILYRSRTGRLLGGVAGLLASCSSGSSDPNITTTRPATGSEAGVPSSDDAAVGADAQVAFVDAALRDGGGQLVAVDAGDASVSSPIACASDMRRQIDATRLQTAQAFDYLAVRELSGPGPFLPITTETWTNSSFSTLSERGQKCATASSPACAAQVKQHPEELVSGSCVQLCTETSVVTTHDDQVQRWAGPARLVELLAPIDSGDEAILLALAAGYQVPCGPSSSLSPVSDGYLLLGTRVTSSCDPVVNTGYQLHVSTAGVLTVRGEFELSRQTGLCIGRVPEGLRSSSHARQRSAYGDHLARCAHLEAASVVAFERLAEELQAHGAPSALVEAALRAASDEQRHTHVISALARAHGGEPGELDVQVLAPRTLEQIALENATEGCVRETYGALVGAYQSEHASDGALAQAMSVIAKDEARHASLSHRIHAWALSRLDRAARERVGVAQTLAVARLLEECATEPELELLQRAGLPSAALATALAHELSAALWNGHSAYAA